MHLTTLGNYVVQYKHTITTPAVPPSTTTSTTSTSTSTAPVVIPASMLHAAVHQPTGLRCLAQVIEKREPRDGAALAREVKAQMLAQSLPDPSVVLKLREVLQDQLNTTAGEAAAGVNGGRGLKRKFTGDSSTVNGDQANKEQRTTGTTAAPSTVHRYYLMFEGFRDGEACDMLEFMKLLGKLPDQLAKSLFRQLLEAVADLHDLGLVHGDLKLPNVLVLRDTVHEGFKVKVKDFRYSTILANNNGKNTAVAGAVDSATGSSGSARPTPPGTVVTEKGEMLVVTHKGSPAYLAPEVTHLNEPYDGKKADTYALGVILYTLLYGSYPIVATSLADLFDLIRRGAINFPVGPTKEATDLAAKLLDKDPQTRLTPRQALRHPWLYDSACDEEQIVPFQSCAVAAKKIATTGLRTNARC